ncbi:MAG TPA: hypothetical protein VF665_21475 [Longimicrobium sp.]|jgi:hypothetical protein|uniref:hypothetical protein n=1 Tax=Longimicrobium sp. TaxID=2029185 RepID=UPI002EDA8104
MKTLWFCVIVLCSSAPALAHAQAGGGFGTAFPMADRQLHSSPVVEPISRNFDSIFGTEESKRNFKRLREYREERKALLDRLRSQVDPLRTVRDETRTILEQRQVIARELDALLARGSTGNAKVYIASSLPISYDNILGGVSTPDSVDGQSIGRLKQHLDPEVAQAKESLERVDKALAMLTANISNLEEDLRRCETAIDLALAPEYKNIDFKIKMSIAFSVLIGVMIVAFFIVIGRSSEATIGSLMLSDGGLQFVTIFVLIIAIILFGILSILEGRELAAILSGIAGYILGRGSQVKKESAEPAAAPKRAPEKPASNGAAPPELAAASADATAGGNTANIPAQAIYPSP